MKKILLSATALLLFAGSLFAQPNPTADPGLISVTTVPSFLLGPNAQGVTNIQYGNFGFDPIPVGAVQITLSLNQYFNYMSPVDVTGFSVFSPDPETVILTNTTVIQPVPLGLGTISLRVVAVATTGPSGVPGVFAQKPYNANISLNLPISAGNTNPNNDNVDANIRVGDASLAPLPVSLVSFSAKAVNCSSQLTWKAAGEDDLKHYEVEQSNDGVHFSFLQKVQGKGGIANDYTLQIAATGKKNYYRLAIVQKDGQRKYSTILPVTLDCGGNEFFSVYPNPVKKGEAVTIQSSLQELVTYKISDVAGKLVETGKFQGRTDVSKQLAGGTYVIELSSGATKKQVKIIVQ